MTDDVKYPFFISIGPSCNVKWALNTFFGKKETLFFDWALTNLTSVTQILGIEDVNDILSSNSLIQNEKTPTFSDKSRVLINCVDYWESIHEVPINFTEDDLDEFINKYKRRHERTIDIIKNPDYYIFFIYYSNASNRDKRNFIDCIKNIKKNNFFTLVELGKFDENIVFTRENKNLLTINLNMLNNREKKKDDWTTSHIDWETIFSIIIQN